MQMEKNLKRAAWILSAKHLDLASAYHLWVTLFRSRIWYAAILIASENGEVRNWLSSYMYRSIKSLFRIKGLPSSQRTVAMATGLSPELLINAEIKSFQATRLIPISEEEREALVLRMNWPINTDSGHLQQTIEDRSDH